MTPQEALARVIEHREIFHEEMLGVMRAIMSGEVSPTLIAAIVTGLRVKKETIGEIAAAAEVMREFATKVPVPDEPNLIDTCGTGGDSAHSFNISTAAMFVAAAAGAKIAKHGGRSVSSKSGSADVLEALGVNINLKPEQVARSIQEIGVGFMFAPNHHSAMKHAAPVRRELGVKTIFNILGPLTNPAGAKQQVMGVFHPDLVGIQARVLQRLGSRRVMIVHGAEGLDEISISGPTMVGELKDGNVNEYTIAPQDFGLKTQAAAAIKVESVEQSRAMVLAALGNETGAARDIVALNAGASIYVAGLAPTVAGGVQKALAASAGFRARRAASRDAAGTEASTAFTQPRSAVVFRALRVVDPFRRRPAPAMAGTCAARSAFRKEWSGHRSPWRRHLFFGSRIRPGYSEHPHSRPAALCRSPASRSEQTGDGYQRRPSRQSRIRSRADETGAGDRFPRPCAMGREGIP